MIISAFILMIISERSSILESVARDILRRLREDRWHAAVADTISVRRGRYDTAQYD